MNRIPLIVTDQHPCSYLDDQQARTAFVSPHYQATPYSVSRLAEVGFRRSGQYLYRPQCDHCSACQASRIPITRFQANRQQRRCWRNNRDLHVRQHHDISHDRYYLLYQRYIEQRHRDGDMYPPSREQYRDFLCTPWQGSFYLDFYLQQQLLAVALVDQYDHGLSAVYTFYDPDFEQRSLGTYAVLKQLQIAAALGLPYLYLGYYVAGCDKMNYKARFKPLEVLQQQAWRPLADQ